MADIWADNLQLIIFTRNRDKQLADTLAQIADSALHRCQLIVLDNASDDETRLVCERFASRLPGLKVVHRPVNIGAEGNLFDALYRARAGGLPYAWILCDDDIFDWEGLGELEDLIAKGHMDAILVGSPGLQRGHLGYRGNVGGLINRGCRFHFVATFVPGLIFRSELVTGEVLQTAEKLLEFYWPNLPLANVLVTDDLTVAVLSRSIIFRKGTSPLSSIFFSWCRCALELPGDRFVCQAVKALFPNWFSIRVAAMTIRERARGGLDVWQIIYLLQRLPWKMGLLRLWIALLIVFPRPFFLMVDKTYERAYAWVTR